MVFRVPMGILVRVFRLFLHSIIVLYIVIGFIHEIIGAADDNESPIVYADDDVDVYRHDAENQIDVDDDDVVSDAEDDTDFPLDEIARSTELRSDIAAWSLSHNITHGALRDIAAVINKFAGKNLLPKDARTLLQTPRTVEIRPLGNDQYYWHNGLKFCLENLFAGISNSITISLNFNMDGLPLFESARKEFWPILCNITEFPKIQPMVIGIYYIQAKASNLDGYLTPLVNELKSLCNEGIDLNGHHITVNIRSFICDSPARAFIKGTFILHTCVVQ